MVQPVEIDLTKMEPILEQYQGEQGMLIPLLQDIQAVYNYLPEAALVRVSEALEIPLSQVFGVSTFFKAFCLEPRGRHIVTVCMGTACHVRGAQRLVEKLERDLDVKDGGTTKDMNFTLETVNCLGCCALGPVLVVDGKYEGKMDSAKLDKVVKRYQDS